MEFKRLGNFLSLPTEKAWVYIERKKIKYLFLLPLFFQQHTHVSCLQFPSSYWISNINSQPKNPSWWRPKGWNASRVILPIKQQQHRLSHLWTPSNHGSVFMNECLAEKQPVLDINMCIVFMMMFFELFLLRKISEFPRGTRTRNLQIAGETL